jgi:anti-sigma B factor antagonist
MFVRNPRGFEAGAPRRICNTPELTSRRPRERVAAGLRIHVERFGGRVAVIHVVGEIDMLTVPELEPVLHRRLRSTLAAVVLDLSGVTFLSCGGVSMIARERDYARARGIGLNVVSGGSHPVEVALQACGLADMLAEQPDETT